MIREGDQVSAEGVQPAMVVEVTSPDTRQNDVETKVDYSVKMIARDLRQAARAVHGNAGAVTIRHFECGSPATPLPVPKRR